MKEILGSDAVVGPIVEVGTFRNSHKHVCAICLRSKFTRTSHQGHLPVNEAVEKYFGCDVYVLKLSILGILSSIN